MKHCQNCGRPLSPAATFCPDCMTSQRKKKTFRNKGAFSLFRKEFLLLFFYIAALPASFLLVTYQKRPATELPPTRFFTSADSSTEPTSSETDSSLPVSSAPTSSEATPSLPTSSVPTSSEATPSVPVSSTPVSSAPTSSVSDFSALISNAPLASAPEKNNVVDTEAIITQFRSTHDSSMDFTPDAMLYSSPYYFGYEGATSEEVALHLANYVWDIPSIRYILDETYSYHLRGIRPIYYLEPRFSPFGDACGINLYLGYRPLSWKDNFMDSNLLIQTVEQAIPELTFNQVRPGQPISLRNLYSFTTEPNPHSPPLEEQIQRFCGFIREDLQGNPNLKYYCLYFVGYRETQWQTSYYFFYGPTYETP